MTEISIHAPRERSDVTSIAVCAVALLFQSTLLVRGATRLKQVKIETKNISIHAPRERSDNILDTVIFLLLDFNPRSS